MPNAIIFDTEATDKNNPVIIEAAWLELSSLSPFTTAIHGCNAITQANQLVWGL
jgi:hypothetical protein